MSLVVTGVLKFLALLFIPCALAFSPKIDIKGVVKSFDQIAVVLETHGRSLQIPREAFEASEVLEVGASVRARVQLKDLKRIRAGN